MKTRLIAHLNRNCVLDHKQFGYQSRIGTQDAIETLVTEVRSKLNSAYGSWSVLGS